MVSKKDNRNKQRAINTKEFVLVAGLLLAIIVSGFAASQLTGAAVQTLPDDGGSSYISGGGTTNYIPKFTSPSSIGNSVIYENNRKIGIGTTNPQTNLHINSTNSFSNPVPGIIAENYRNVSGAGAFIRTAVGGEGALNPVFQMYIKDSDWWSIGVDNPDQNKFKISKASNVGLNDRLTITTDGKVGIGTTDPQAKLDVNGGIRVSPSATPLWSTPPNLIIKTDPSNSYALQLLFRDGNTANPRITFGEGAGTATIETLPNIGLNVDVGASQGGFRLRTSTGYQMPLSDRIVVDGGRNIATISFVNSIVNIQTLSGSGNAYVCADSRGTLYRSTLPCV